MHTGYLSLVLHAHLPFVRHPEHEDFLEERWFFEAVTEAYLPLLGCLERLGQDRVPCRLSLDLTPTLCAMLRDELLQARYVRHLHRLVELAEREMRRTRGDDRFHPLAAGYRDGFVECLDRFENRYRRDLLSAFAACCEAGQLELATSAATHGFLPLLKTEPEAVRAQIAIGQESFRRTFGRPAAGFWLPECAYYPGLETVLAGAGIRYVIVDSHAVLHASVRPQYGLLAPVACPNGVAAFPRDPESSRQVWSAHGGYPGDPCYREFYRDIGFDLPVDDLRPCLPEGTTRVFTGIKYHRITGPTDAKAPYNPAAAAARVRTHADHFLAQRRAQVDSSARSLDRPPLLLSPYDAELFGHWWFEGPQFIEALFRRAAVAYPGLVWLTPSDYLERHPFLQRATPSASSWGDQGYHAHWLSDPNDWIYPHLHQAAQRMRDLAGAHAHTSPGTPLHRALNQAARSLLLAQASDWPFLLKAGASSDYARSRLQTHFARFAFLCDAIDARTIDLDALAALEEMDNLFPWIDFRAFATSSPEPPHRPRP